ncbi:TPA: helix-turn-helix domain-containing protein [Providencia alcalifaciens]
MMSEHLSFESTQTYKLPIQDIGFYFAGENEAQINNLIGHYIRKKRKELGLTGSQIASRVGVSQQQFSRYEVGISNITLPRLFLIISKLDMDIETFLNDLVVIVKRLHTQD